jgi:hypothetical protein
LPRSTRSLCALRSHVLHGLLVLFGVTNFAPRFGHAGGEQNVRIRKPSERQLVLMEKLVDVIRSNLRIGLNFERVLGKIIDCAS